MWQHQMDSGSLSTQAFPLLREAYTVLPVVLRAVSWEGLGVLASPDSGWFPREAEQRGRIPLLHSWAL